MQKEIHPISKEIIELFNELESYELYKKNIIEATKKVFDDYQAKKYTYAEYEKELKRILKNKTKSYWVEYYNSYIYSLLKKIENMNDQMLYCSYSDKSHLELKVIVEKPAEIIRIEKPAKEIPAKAEKRKIKPEIKEKIKPEAEAKPEIEFEEETREGVKEGLLTATPEMLVKKVRKEEELKLKEPTLLQRIKSFFALTKKAKAEKRKKEALPEIKIKKPLKGKPIIEEEERAKKEKPIEQVLGFGLIKHLIKKAFRPNKEFISKETTLSPSMQLSSIRERMGEQIPSEIAPTVLAEEVRHVKELLEARKGFKVYKPSFIGSIANVLIKQLTFYLIETFPNFFKSIYNSFRLANITILSNTYVNIMLLSIILSLLFFSFIFGMFFVFMGNSIVMVIGKTILLSLLMAFITFLSFYGYPFMKIRKRSRDIRANLPFAINHLAALSNSGVPPAKMFKLIAQSEEYGEISVEIEKIVEFIDLFGYDLLTALRSVAATSPSMQLKDFFEGFISTIESGGDLNNYLMQKSKEAMLNYELERHKYMESISTYSDIYTGILIAAPLFFMVALSLVGLLGGAIGGIDVNVLIVMGTYVFIPILNVLFMIFLEITQPQA